MKGYLEERHGSYLIRVSLGKDPTTKKYRQYTETVKSDSINVAQKRLREVLTELDKGLFTKPTKITLGQHLDQWLKTYAWANLSPVSAETYEYMVCHYIKPTLGQIALKSLRPEHIQKLYGQLLDKGLGNRSVRYVHTTLHKSLSTAVKQGLIARNPVDLTDPPHIKSKEMSAMDENQVQRFLEIARETPYASMFYLFLTTGLRRGEVLALKWSDLNLIDGQLSVNRVLSQLHFGERKNEVIIKEPKTKTSRRLVALSPSTVKMLKSEYETQSAIKQSLGMQITSDDLVFCHVEDGRPILPDAVTHSFHRTALRAGLKDIHTHSSRHTHASLLLKQGVHPAIVAQRLGHSSVRITLDVYSHILPGLQQAAANKFDDLITPNKALLPGKTAV